MQKNLKYPHLWNFLGKTTKYVPASTKPPIPYHPMMIQ